MERFCRVESAESSTDESDVVVSSVFLPHGHGHARCPRRKITKNHESSKREYITGYPETLKRTLGLAASRDREFQTAWTISKCGRVPLHGSREGGERVLGDPPPPVRMYAFRSRIQEFEKNAKRMLLGAGVPMGTVYKRPCNATQDDHEEPRTRHLL